jgi:hypothetical protein
MEQGCALRAPRPGKSRLPGSIKLVRPLIPWNHEFVRTESSPELVTVVGHPSRHCLSAQLLARSPSRTFRLRHRIVQRMLSLSD